MQASVGCGSPAGCSATVQPCTSPAQEQPLSRALPTADVFYQGFSTHLLGAGLAEGTVWERTAFPGANVGAVPGKAPAHERWHPWHWVPVAVCPPGW